MLRMTKTGLLAVALVVCASATALAQGDPEAGDIDTNLPERKKPVQVEEGPKAFRGQPGPLRLYGGLSLAFGGELKGAGDDDDDDVGFDLDPTIGLQIGADYVLHKYFSIGGETRLMFWKLDEQGDRNLFWDLDVKPRGRYAFDNIALEVYGALPLGLTIAGLNGQWEGGAGWNIGIVAGANYFFNERMGLNTELGWLFHKFNVDFGFAEGKAKTNQALFLPTVNFIYVL